MKRFFAFLLALLFVASVGCDKNPQAPVPKANNDPKKAILPDDPLSKEVRAVAGEILDRLVANKLTEDESSLQLRANALKGFKAWTFESQRQNEDGRVTLDGYLTGTAGKARFSMLLVKQNNGKWAVGSFSGPNPVE